MEFKNLDELKA
ncbi:Protein of unknown function [Lactobacillus helveticus CIRM-BIA 103]|nr:Protein of unknown function [Lactobacillus helveticus CIRM-BIA 103]